MARSSCPVFSPTFEEFKDFRGYMDKIYPQASSVGICKIIPPIGWFSRTYELDSIPIVIETPVKQIVTGRAGVFEVNLFEIDPMTPEDIAIFDASNNYAEADYDQRERKFWRSLGCASEWQDPIYGADVLGSLFEDNSACGWNLNKLDSILSYLGSAIPGVNCGYLYFGTWRAMFAYHTEDFDLFSINYLHSGAAKSWYAIPMQNRKLFESMAQSYFSEESQQCHEYLRHKTKMFSPTRLKECGINYATVLQHAGEFVITFPGSYHAGFNHGFNIAEATNFATANWLETGRKAKPCVCRPGAVRINLDCLETNLLRDEIRKRKNKKSSRDNALSVYGARLRCCCGDKTIVKCIDRATTKSCSACSLYFHVNCRNILLDALNCPKALEISNLHQLCHLCAILDSNSKPDGVDDIFSLAPIAVTTVELATTAENEAIPDIKTKAANSNAGTARLEQFDNMLVVGMLVTAQVKGQIFPIQGTIVDIEDNLGRLHVKGNRRDQDLWLPLDSMESTAISARSTNPMARVSCEKPANERASLIQNRIESQVKDHSRKLKRNEIQQQKLIPERIHASQLSSMLIPEVSQSTESDDNYNNHVEMIVKRARNDHHSGELLHQSMELVQCRASAGLPEAIFESHREKLRQGLTGIYLMQSSNINRPTMLILSCEFWQEIDNYRLHLEERVKVLHGLIDNSVLTTETLLIRKFIENLKDASGDVSVVADYLSQLLESLCPLSANLISLYRSISRFIGLCISIFPEIAMIITRNSLVMENPNS